MSQIKLETFSDFQEHLGDYLIETGTDTYTINIEGMLEDQADDALIEAITTFFNLNKDKVRNAKVGVTTIPVDPPVD